MTRYPIEPSLAAAHHTRRRLQRFVRRGYQTITGHLSLQRVEHRLLVYCGRLGLMKPKP